MKCLFYIFLCLILLGLPGCSSRFWGGAAVGAAYEYNAHQEMKRLEEDFRISLPRELPTSQIPSLTNPSSWV